MEKHFEEHAARFAEAVEGLRGKRVAVLGHVRPDGDCIGSQVAMARILRSLGIDAKCYNQHPVPGNCRAFVGDTPFEDNAQRIDTGRVVVTVDCADRKRLGLELIENIGGVYLNVDHHISNTGYAEYNLIEGAASATGEVLAGIFLDNGYAIDPVTAQALYIGIATDTGQFRFGSTTRMTFEICCHLMERGADPAAAALQLYEQETPAKMALLQRFLASFERHCDGRVCIGTIRDADWKATGASKEDTEGLVDYARSIEGVEIGILIEEQGAMVKGSFRAKEPLHRVDLLAKEFNGGGHACAAGFNPEMPVDELYPKLVARMERHFAELEESA